MRKKVVIMGAAGRDFFNFQRMYKNNSEYDVVAFTATQIPDVDNREYPKSLAGEFYSKGIPIYNEEQLEGIIKKYDVDDVVFSYSDVSYEHVMRCAARAISAGANFILLGRKSTELKSKKPVISICAVRTGCGKSPTTRYIVKYLREKNIKVGIVRHPMSYGNLEKMRVQKFSSIEDLDVENCTIEEMEEYEPHIKMGVPVYAGVEYDEILKLAEEDADLIIWDGGNNDTPFYKSDLHIVLTDSLRPGHEIKYYPGEINLRMADVVIINKVNVGTEEAVREIEKNVKNVNPDAKIFHGELIAEPDDDGNQIRGMRVLVIEDGPTITHGELSYGAGYIVARKYGAREIVNPKDCAVGSIQKAFDEYTHIEHVLPALGYSEKQVKELEDTINRCECDIVVSGTPINIKRILNVNKPVLHITYRLKIQEEEEFKRRIDECLKKCGVI